MKMELDRVIKAMVGNLYGEEAHSDKALSIALSVRGTIYKDGKSFACCATLFFLFNRPYGSRGFCTTHTFGAAKYGTVFEKTSNGLAWEHLSSHDSCWADAIGSFIYKHEMTFFSMLFEDMLRAGVDAYGTCAHDIHWLIDFRGFGGEWAEWIPCKVEYDNREGAKNPGYTRKITLEDRQ